AFGLDTWETPDVIREQVEKILDAHPEDAAVILCDIKGGSVHNRLFDLCLRDQVSLVTGMNLALALELAVSWEGTKEEVKQTLELARENLAYFDCCSIQNTEEKEDGELW
ncbi:MAG: hypothetical protein LUH19_07840, partial [Lachnospiraceae bacterium]|nr:hypothetical protein [Lachnospiraceae bacterium]